MKKLRRDLTVAMAGACSGLFSVSVFLLAARVQTYYDFLRFREATNYDVSYNHVEDLWWVPVVVWHVVLAIAASLLIHRYVATGRSSTFLRWQSIGLVTLVGWCLTAFLAVGLECLVRGSTQPIEYAWLMFKPVPVGQFVAGVFASNVLFGSAVQAASREELRER